MRWIGIGEEKRNMPKEKNKGKHTYTKPDPEKDGFILPIWPV